MTTITHDFDPYGLWKSPNFLIRGLRRGGVCMPYIKYYTGLMQMSNLSFPEKPMLIIINTLVVK